MNDYNMDGTPFEYPVSWHAAGLVVFAVVAYPILIVGLCAGWW